MGEEYSPLFDESIKLVDMEVSGQTISQCRIPGTSPDDSYAQDSLL